MGKRSIAELPVFDLLVLLVLGSVVGADIADPDINHIHTVIAMIAIALLQKSVIGMKLKNRKIGKWLTFEPTVVLYQGKLLDHNIRKIHYSIDNILNMLREKDIFQIEDVEFAIVESNGSLSVKRYPHKEVVTNEIFHGFNRGGGYEIPLILDGHVQMDVLLRIGKSTGWLREKLKEKKVKESGNVFYAAMTSNEQIVVSLKGQEKEGPPIQH
ncbi:DUF421 domain-containing protein [Halobacillus fulvus]|nr:DUF421 domain-containing protein [Halobacillus fulvus]